MDHALGARRLLKIGVEFAPKTLDRKGPGQVRANQRSFPACDLRRRRHDVPARTRRQLAPGRGSDLLRFVDGRAIVVPVTQWRAQWDEPWPWPVFTNRYG